MEADLIAYMLASSALTALVSTRIWPVSRPSNSALPAITVTRISGSPEYADDGEIGVENARVQVDCWGTSYASVAAVADAVTNRMSAAADVVQGSTTFVLVMVDDRRDMRESGTDLAEYLYRTLVDLTTIYKGV